MNKKLFLILLLVGLIALPALAAIPEAINIQGVLVKNDGTPVTGTYSMTLIIDDDINFGSPAVSKNKSLTFDDSGFFSVTLEVQGVDFDQPTYFQLKGMIDNNQAIFIQPLLSVPYAISAKHGESGFKLMGYAKFASMDVADAPKEAGTMLFNKDSKRLMYHDGSQWIQIDPLYTEKEYKFFQQPNDTNLSQGNPLATFTLLTALNDVVITGVSVNYEIVYTAFVKFELKNGNKLLATFFRWIDGDNLNSNHALGTITKNFVFPIKIKQGDTISLAVTRIGGASTVKISKPGIEYIDFPW